MRKKSESVKKTQSGDKVKLLHWKCHTPRLLQEIGNNNNMNTIQKPLMIFARLLEEVADRAIKLNDGKLNALMCRLTLYECADPYSKDYDEKLTKKTISKFYK
jgi:hypothetical protein